MKKFVLDQLDRSGRKLEGQVTIYAKNVAEAIAKADEIYGKAYIHREIK